VRIPELDGIVGGIVAEDGVGVIGSQAGSGRLLRSGGHQAVLAGGFGQLTAEVGEFGVQIDGGRGGFGEAEGEAGDVVAGDVGQHRAGGSAAFGVERRIHALVSGAVFVAGGADGLFIDIHPDAAAFVGSADGDFGVGGRRDFDGLLSELDAIGAVALKREHRCGLGRIAMHDRAERREAKAVAEFSLPNRFERRMIGGEERPVRGVGNSLHSLREHQREVRFVLRRRRFDGFQSQRRQRSFGHARRPFERGRSGGVLGLGIQIVDRSIDFLRGKDAVVVRIPRGEVSADDGGEITGRLRSKCPGTGEEQQGEEETLQGRMRFT